MFENRAFGDALAEELIPLISFLANLNSQAVDLFSAFARIGVLNVSLRTAFGLTFAGAAFAVEVFVGCAEKGLGAHASAVRVVEPLLEGVLAFGRARGTFALAGIFVVEGHSQVFAVVAAFVVLVETVDQADGGCPPGVVDFDFDDVAAAFEGGLLQGYFVRFGRVGVSSREDPLSI